jgi:putative FmdB family regulatory protein
MPIYEYRCNDCGRKFELMQKITEKAPKDCKYCSGKVERLISQTNFQLKGGGWHADGYSKNKVKEESKPKECQESKKPECAGCPSSS